MTARTVGAFAPDVPGGPSDHACWGYRTDAERAQIVCAWLEGGLSLGQRAAYVADATAEQLAAELMAISDAADALATGALVVIPSTALYDLSQPINPEAQLAIYAGAVDEALAAGYRGLRVAADITPLVRDTTRRPAHLRWEQHADRYIAEHPLAPLCLYDTREIRDIDAIMCVHHLQGPEPSAFSYYGAGGATASLEGELDSCVAEVMHQVLSAMPVHDHTIDVERLAFVDAGAAWALQDVLKRRRDEGADVRLAGAPPRLRRVWNLCGFDPMLLAG
jgi:anti-anti-sigma regulatory factor